MTDYNKITTDEFDHALALILDGMSSEAILQIPGVYRVASDELNNAALNRALVEFHNA